MEREDLRIYFKENYVKDFTLSQKIVQLALWVIFVGSAITLTVAVIMYGRTLSDLFMVSLVVAIPSLIALLIIERLERKRKVLKPVSCSLSDEDVDAFALTASEKFAAQFEDVLFANYVYMSFEIPDSPEHYCKNLGYGQKEAYCKICGDKKRRTSLFTVQALTIKDGIMTINKAFIDILTGEGVSSMKELRLAHSQEISFGETFEQKFLQLGDEGLNLNEPFIGGADELLQEVRKYVLVDVTSQIKGF
jgi:hypothetical protein